MISHLLCLKTGLLDLKGSQWKTRKNMGFLFIYFTQKNLQNSNNSRPEKSDPLSLQSTRHFRGKWSKGNRIARFLNDNCLSTGVCAIHLQWRMAVSPSHPFFLSSSNNCSDVKEAPQNLLTRILSVTHLTCTMVLE